MRAWRLIHAHIKHRGRDATCDRSTRRMLRNADHRQQNAGLLAIRFIANKLACYFGRATTAIIV
jgi:hypothetical protein